jgi:hypothetical protein
MENNAQQAPDAVRRGAYSGIRMVGMRQFPHNFPLVMASPLRNSQTLLLDKEIAFVYHPR